jgi:hypothetical protein
MGGKVRIFLAWSSLLNRKAKGKLAAAETTYGYSLAVINWEFRTFGVTG